MQRLKKWLQFKTKSTNKFGYNECIEWNKKIFLFCFFFFFFGRMPQLNFLHLNNGYSIRSNILFGQTPYSYISSITHRNSHSFVWIYWKCPFVSHFQPIHPFSIWSLLHIHLCFIPTKDLNSTVTNHGFTIPFYPIVYLLEYVRYRKEKSGVITLT